MTRRQAFVALALALAVATVARSGHELPIYPSYYPHQIELETVAPGEAADLLRTGGIQAYVGGAPRFPGAPPDTVDSVESLGSFVVVRVNPSSPRAADAHAACALTDAVVGGLAGRSQDLIVHPYPVTPFHGDYLHHVDLAEAAKARLLGGRADAPSPRTANLKVKAASALTQSVVPPQWRAEAADWDAEIAEVGAAELVGGASMAMNGWLGPPGLRAGWFHAFLLLRGQRSDEEMQRIESQLGRLQSSADDGAVERINLERSLVTTLAGGCYARVAGYTVKREHYSTIFTAGIENIAFDSIAGLNSPIFIRTVKLRDFPWNGELALGIAVPPTAAWNPIAGFTDPFGRLMWSAIGDPASIPSPYEAAWMLNRISDVQSSASR